MTVSTQVSRNEYTGNGATTQYDFTFRILDKSHLLVQTLDTSESIVTLTLGTDYTVTGVNRYNGGKVVLTSALPAGYKISIERSTPVTQEASIRNQGGFFPEIHEDAFDKLTMLVQQAYGWWSGLSLRKPSWLANYYDALNNRIRNLRDPSQAQDAATKNYVDGQIVDNTNAWKAGDAILDQKIDSNFRRTIRVPESDVDMVPSAEARRDSLFGWNSSGKPVQIFSMTQTADLALKLASEESGLGSSLVGHEDGGTVRDYISFLTPQSQGAPCNGIDDDSTWFNALANSGKKVLVPAGNYVLDCNKINISSSDCEIQFDKNAKVQVINTSGLTGANAEAVVFRISGTSLATVYNFRISGGQFTFADDRIALVGVLSYVDGVKIDRVKVTGLRLIATNDANNNYTNSTSASRSKRVTATYCIATAATVATHGAAISFRYSDYGTTSNNIIYGYYYGIMFWGGDSNPNSNGNLGNERKCIGIRSNSDRISAIKAAWWGSMGRDCVAESLSCYGIGTDTDVGVDFEGCVNCAAVGCYVKDFRYGCFATFFYSDGIIFDSCVAEITLEGYRVFTINNSSQNANNRSITYNNCLMIGNGACSIVYQQGAVNDLTISNCMLRNVVLHLDSLNNGQIAVNNIIMNFDRTPVDGRDFNGTIYFTPLVINSSLLSLRDCSVKSSVSWTSLSGATVGIILMSRSSNANALHRIDGGGITNAQFDCDLILANIGTNVGVTLRFEIEKFVFAAKKYKTLLFSTSTLMPIGIVRGKTLTLSDFPTSITDNAGYSETFYTRRQQFINQSPTAGGVLGTVVVTAGVGTSAVTANIPIS